MGYWEFLKKFFGWGAALRPPDFEQSVGVVLPTFAVLVGIAITNFLDPDKMHLPEELHYWAFAALVSLLLRYIIGSAIHLTDTYGKNRVPAAGGVPQPTSFSVVLFFKDLVFLVLFGVLAVRITQALDLADFIDRALSFLFAGLAWSASDPALREIFARFGATRERQEKPLWILWLVLDGLQILSTWLVARWCPTDLATAQALAVLFALFLLADFKCTVRALQIT